MKITPQDLWWIIIASKIAIDDSNWFESAKIIRCWSESNSANRICCTFTKYKQLKCWWCTISFRFNDFRKDQTNKIKVLSKKCNALIKDSKLWKKQELNSLIISFTKIKFPAKNALRITEKNFQNEKLSHKLVITIWLKTRKRNGFVNKIPIQNLVKHNYPKLFN